MSGNTPNWRRQPGPAVPFKADNTTRFVTHWPRGIAYAELVSGGLVGTGGPVVSPSVAGLGLRTVSASSQYAVKGTSALGTLGGSDPYTIASAFVPSNTSTRGTLVSLGSISANTQYVWLEINATSGKASFNTRPDAGGGEILVTSNSFTAGQLCTAVAVNYGAASRKVVLNGQIASAGSGTTSYSGQTFSLTRTGVGAMTGPTAMVFFDGWSLVQVIEARAWSDAEIHAFAENPWWRFAARRPWVPVSAGGGSTSLTVNETAHAHSADALTLTTSAVLTIADATHAHAAESPAPSSSLGLTIAEALHGHAADSLTLSVTGSESLVTADATHGHAADSLALSSDTGLTVADALHGHAADNLTLDTTGAATLTTQDATHAHAVDAPMLYTDWLLAVAEATHGHAADNLSLSDAPELAPQDAAHGHTADVLALSADTWLTIQQADHAQSAENLALTASGTGTCPTAAEIAAEVLAALMAASIPVDVQKMNGAEVIGTGTTGDSWRGVGVAP